MNDWKVLVFSYHREETVERDTLDTLRKGRVPSKKIALIVATEEERRKYAKAVSRSKYGRIIVSLPGLTNARNWVAKKYANGERLVCMDDDVRGIRRKAGDKSKPVTDLPALFDEGFHAAEGVGARLWGIAASTNDFYLTESLGLGLVHVVGCFYGLRNDPSIQLRLKVGAKEDYERSVLYYLADGTVARMNWYRPDTTYYAKKGGLTEMRPPEVSEKEARELVGRYPNLLKLSGIRGGHRQILVRREKML